MFNFMIVKNCMCMNKVALLLKMKKEATFFLTDNRKSTIGTYRHQLRHTYTQQSFSDM